MIQVSDQNVVVFKDQEIWVPVASKPTGNVVKTWKNLVEAMSTNIDRMGGWDMEYQKFLATQWRTMQVFSVVCKTKGHRRKQLDRMFEDGREIFQILVVREESEEPML